jgi:hypothetical protein
MTTTITDLGWVGSLTVGDPVAVKFFSDTHDINYIIDTVRFDGVVDDLAYFTSVFDDDDDMVWTAYIGPDGAWCYGYFDMHLAPLTPKGTS